MALSAFPRPCVAGSAIAVGPRMLRVFSLPSLACAILGSMLLSTGEVRADEAPRPPRTVSLEHALREAQARQPSIRTALARVQERRAESRIPDAAWLPRVGATAQLFGATANNTTASFVSTPESSTPRVGATPAELPGSLRPYASSYLAASLDQRLFDFGKVAAETAARDALVVAETERSRVTRLDVLFQVEEAWYAVQAARAVLRSATDAVARSRAHRDLAQSGVSAGLRSPIELTRAEADVARFENALLQAQAGLDVAREVLGATVGETTPLDTLGEAPAPQNPPSLSAAVRIASERDPLIRTKMAELDAQRKVTAAVGALMRPELHLVASLSVRAGGAPTSSNLEPEGIGFLPYIPNYSAGLVLHIPIFDGIVGAEQEASRAQQRVREQELAETVHEQTTIVRQAWIGFSAAQRELPGLERSVQAARANHDQAEARFNAGMGTSVELADAEMLLTQAEIQLALGKFAVVRARAALGRAMAERL
jgi:outer membrane protein